MIHILVHGCSLYVLRCTALTNLLPLLRSSSADLVKEATESGLFLEQGGSVKLAAHCLGASPSRGLLLLAMHACTIKLTPVFDTVSGPGQSRVPVEQFWAHISSAGGPEKVCGCLPTGPHPPCPPPTDLLLVSACVLPAWLSITSSIACS